MLCTGEVYRLPPGLFPDDDPKNRPHVLLTDTKGDNTPCTLAYCSSQGTESGYGAANLLLNPHSSSYRGTGFTQPTYVYPSRLVTVNSGDLGEPVGRIIDELAVIRGLLREALGLGTGSGNDRGVAAGTLRGQIVVLKSGFADVFDTPYALLVTEPIYSLQQRYQLAVPVFNAEENEEEVRDVVATGDPTELRRLGIDFTGLLFGVAYVESLYHPLAIERATALYAPNEVLSQIDRQFTLLFGI